MAMALRPVSAFRAIHNMHLKLALSNPVPHELRQLHTTRPVQSAGVLAALGAFYDKFAAAVVPADSWSVADKAVDTKPRLRFQSTPGLKSHPAYVPDSDGAGVKEANQLLTQLIEANKKEMPELKPYREIGIIRQVRMCEQPAAYVESRRGTLWVSKDILTTLTRNELLMLFATEIMHHLCNHEPKTRKGFSWTDPDKWFFGSHDAEEEEENLSEADMAVLEANVCASVCGYRRILMKNQCLIADDLALKMASKMGVTEQDAASLLEKLTKFLKSPALPELREE